MFTALGVVVARVGVVYVSVVCSAVHASIVANVAVAIKFIVLACFVNEAAAHSYFILCSCCQRSCFSCLRFEFSSSARVVDGGADI